MAANYHRDGFLRLPQVVPEELVDRVREAVEPLYERAEAIEARRIQDAWKVGAEAVRDLAVFEPVLSLLRVLYERQPIPFQTLNFKWGSQQNGHSDSIHFNCIPARYMCGVWVALEDTHEQNGPLFYYPGSHRLPEITAYDLDQTVDSPQYPLYEEYQHQLMQELGIAPVEFHARKGDALIWSSNVVHGGMPTRDEAATRWSQVTHFYFERCIYFTPIFSDMPTGELLLKNIVDLSTMRPVGHTYNGEPLRIRTLSNGRSRMTRVSAIPLGEDEDGDDADGLRAALAAARAEAAALTAARAEVAALTAARAEVAALRQSTSFRLGNAIVRPAHVLRSRRR
jgi:hypothetical protein